jgi:DNA-binding NtrC family response regulator
VDVRLLAATNADLDALVARGRFRQDLFYRLSVMPIRVPSLRERTEDVAPLSRALLARICGEYRVAPLDLAPEALSYLERYPWRGNVRELENVLRRAVINVQPGDEQLRLAHLEATPPARGSEAAAPEPHDGLRRSFAEQKTEWERQLLQVELARHAGNREATARSLGMTVRNLYYRLRRLGVG